MSNVVRMTKEGKLQVGNQIVDLDEFLEKLTLSSKTHIRSTMPTEYGMGDWWYNPKTDLLCFCRIIQGKLQWVEVPFGLPVNEE